MRCIDKLTLCKALYRYVSKEPKKQKDILEYLNEFHRYKYNKKDSKYIDIKEGVEFKRLVKTVESEFGIVITPNSYHEWGIDESDEDSDFENVVESYELANSIGFTASNLKELGQMKKFVQFSNANSIKQTEHIPLLLDFCIHSKEVLFDYTKYTDKLEITTMRKVQPYQIREYQGRWYLIGIEPDLAKIEPHPKLVKFRAYGLDRMRNLKKGENFKRDKGQAFKEHYADVIGLVNGYNYQKGTKIDAEKIRLRVDKFSWNYINALPWHSSQKQVDKSKNHVEFELKIKPTKELVQRIIQWSPKVQVLEPESLKDAVLTELKKSVALYK